MDVMRSRLAQGPPAAVAVSVALRNLWTHSIYMVQVHQRHKHPINHNPQQTPVAVRYQLVKFTLLSYLYCTGDAIVLLSNHIQMYCSYLVAIDRYLPVSFDYETSIDRHWPIQPGLRPLLTWVGVVQTRIRIFSTRTSPVACPRHR